MKINIEEVKQKRIDYEITASVDDGETKTYRFRYFKEPTKEEIAQRISVIENKETPTEPTEETREDLQGEVTLGSE